MGILKYLFILLFLCLPLGEIARVQIGNGIAIRLNDVLVGVIVLLWIIDKVRNKNIKKVFSDKIIRLFFVFYSIGFISLLLRITDLTTTEFLVSFAFLARFICYTLLYGVVKDFNSIFKRQLLSVMILSGLLFVFIGFLQVLFYPNLGNLSYLFWDNHMYRMFTSFLDPNFAGAFLVMLFIMLLSIVFFNFSKKRKIRGLVSLTLLLITTFALYITYSRSAYIMFLVSVAVFFVIKGKHIVKTIVILIFLVLFVIAVNNVFSSNYTVENLNLFRVASSEARIKSAETALHIIADHPILGVGFNAYKYTQISYGFRTEEEALRSHADAGTDNSFLFVLATTGVVGLMIYLLILFGFVKRSLTLLKSSKATQFQKLISGVLIAVVAGLVVDALFINSLFYPFILEWVVILLGLTTITENT